MKPIPYGRQTITDEDIDAVVKVLRSDFLTQGPAIEEFEKKFAAYTDAKYAVAVSNGTAALHIAMMALGLNPGEKVITTPITFAASANCVIYCGGEVCFSDIDPVNYLLDLGKLEKLLTSNPKGTFKGIIPVDYAGYPVNTEKLHKIAKDHNLWIVEDACHAPGATFTDSSGNIQKAGNCRYVDMTVFSFHPVKHIATGEGGMITTNSKELYEKLILYRTHGITKSPDLLHENHGGWYYEMIDLGYNYRITDFQAALGTSQLQKADKGLARRREIAVAYNEAFRNIPSIKTPYCDSGVNHAYHLYPIQVENRKGLYDFLRENKIFAQVHYIPVHLMPYYRKLGWKHNDMPVAENFYAHCLSLPMYPALTNEEQIYVIGKILEFVGKK